MTTGGAQSCRISSSGVNDGCGPCILLCSTLVHLTWSYRALLLYSTNASFVMHILHCKPFGSTWLPNVNFLLMLNIFSMCVIVLRVTPMNCFDGVFGN